MTMTTDPRVRAYLDELDRALTDRPAAQRELVVDGVRQHVDDALASGLPVEQVLGDLGDPLAIAAESGDQDEPARTAPPFLERRGGSVLVVLLLAFGGLVVPVLGWIAGVVLLWSSRGWRTVDKVVGTVAPLVGVGLALALAALRNSQEVFAPFHLAILGGPILGSVLGAVYLLVRFRPAR